MPAGNESELMQVLAQAQARQAAGDRAGAEALYRRALAARPGHPAAAHGLAGVLLARGEPDAAADVLEPALAAQPRDAALHATLGLAHKAQGRLEEAALCLATAVEIAPELAEAWVNLGNVHEASARWTEAEGCYRRALEIRPDMAVAHSNLGTALQAQGRIDEALACYRRALALRPGYAAAFDHIGTALLMSSRAAQAAEAFRRALALAPGNRHMLKHLGDALQSLGRLDEALACYRDVRAADPADQGAAAGEAAVLEWLGRQDEAAALVEPLIEAGSDDLSVLLVDARLRAGTAGREEAIARLEARLARSATDYERRRLHFALGRLHDRAGDPDAAFGHIRRANALRDARFDAAAEQRRADAIMEVFSAQSLSALPRSEVRSQAPVFIVGMPRSGTTLVERMLAAHPKVHAAGERDAIERMAASTASAGTAYPASVRMLSTADLNAMARAYLDEPGPLAAAVRRITDKTPLNFLHLGFISMLLPGALVVHCARNAADTCLSCYFQDFEQGHAFAYDLRDLGSFYRVYRRLMAHWEAVRPLPMITVDYERLVAEPEAQVRRLLSFCGLEWDPRCLRFYESKGTALTASYDQVRRPVYTDSVDRHRAYARFLTPLRRALDGDAD
jgi:tetratricopeptide (TPR) repeat protein